MTFKDCITKITLNNKSPFGNKILKWTKQAKPIVVVKTVYHDYNSARSIHCRVTKDNNKY